MRNENLIGQQFGNLTVISIHPNRTNSGKVIWDCQCECGKVYPIIGSNLKRRLKNRRCGCNQVNQMVGGVFGSLTVLTEMSELRGLHDTSYSCQCRCGIIAVFKGTDLRSGRKSCGCRKTDGISNTAHQNTMRQTKENVTRIVFSRYQRNAKHRKNIF